MHPSNTNKTHTHTSKRNTHMSTLTFAGGASAVTPGEVHGDHGRAIERPDGGGVGGGVGGVSGVGGVGGGRGAPSYAVTMCAAVLTAYALRDNTPARPVPLLEPPAHA